jgi:hypothetical protein
MKDEVGAPPVVDRGVFEVELDASRPDNGRVVSSFLFLP